MVDPRSPWRVMAAVLMSALLGAPAAAQITTGNISGTVLDAQGAVVPGATVTLISDTKGTKLAPVVTGENGTYAFPNVTPDTYTVEVTMDGFKTLRRSGVALSAGDRVAIPPLSIQVGGTSETVDVRAESPLIQSQSGERSFTIATEAVQNLPVGVSRNFATLTAFTPGVQVQNGGTTGRLGGGGQNNIMMDGVSAMDTGNNGQLLQMNVEAIAEVKVLTQSYQAEYGRSSGLQISAVTKSGTNRMRGSAYDVIRNSDWYSNSWANQKNGLPKTVVREKDLGYSLGGPVGKPGGNNKLFYFYSHEYRPRESGNQINQFRVPTALERQGDFSQTLDNNGAPYNLIRNAASGLPCSTSDQRGCYADGGVLGRIPQSALYPTGLNILKLWPEPNISVPGAAYNYQVALPTVNTLIQQPAVRLDYQASPKWRTTAKYAGQLRSHETNSVGAAAAPGQATLIPGFNDYFEPHPWIAQVSVTSNYNLNATTFIEATYGWSQNQLGSFVINDISNRFNAGLGALPQIYPDAGLVNPDYYEYGVLSSVNPPYYQDGRIVVPPAFTWGSRVSNTTPNYAPPNVIFPGFLNINRTQDVSISATKVIGRHTAKAGFYLNHSYKAQNQSGNPWQGSLSFANDTNNPLDTTFGFANAATGVFTSYSQNSKFVEGNFLYNNVEWYLQDNWKMNSRLTLDYGLRFVHQQPQYDSLSQSSNFFPNLWSPSAAPKLYLPACPGGVNPCATTARQALNPVTGQLLGPNSSLAIGQVVSGSGNPTNGIVQAGDGIDKTNFTWPGIALAPRFGVAYDVSGNQKLVLRGGGGLFFDRPDGNSVFPQVGNPPLSTSTTIRYATLQNLSGSGLATSGAPTLQIFQYDAKLPSSFQWNFGGQMSLPWSSTLDVSYVGNHSYNLLSGTADINAPDLGAAFAPQNQDPTLAASATPGANALSVDLLRPYAGLGAINMQWPRFHTTYHSIQTTFNRRFRDGLSFGVNHTLGLSFKGNTGTQVRLQHNPDGSFAIREDQGAYEKLLENAGNRRHTVKANAVWDLPDVHGSGGAVTALKVIANDWQLSGVLTAGSGTPYDVGFSFQNGSGINQTLTGSSVYAPRVVVTGDPGSGCSSNQYAQFNTAAFSVPAPSATNPSVGTESSRNYLIGCPDHTVDLAIARNIRVFGGDRELQLRVDVFNVFDSVVYSARNTTLQVASPTSLVQTNNQYDAAGNLVATRLTPQNSGFGAATGANDLRRVQVQIRFQF